MKKHSKALLLSMCAVVLVIGSVFGTIAYLTDQDAVTNTFTVGKVTLGDGELEKGLDEALVNEYGQPINNDTDKSVVDLDKAPRVQTNDYKLVPGHSYTKDPTVHVKNDSESSYIFVKVENGIANIEASTETGVQDGYVSIVDQVKANGWAALTNIDNVYYKKWDKPADSAGTTDLLVFSQFKIDGDKVVGGAGKDVADTTYYLENYKDAKIVVTAYAVQATGFNDAASAWNATFGKPAANS